MLPPFRSTHGITMTNQVGSRVWTENRLTSRLGLTYRIIQGRSHLAAALRCPMSAEVRPYAGMIGRLVAEQPHAPFPYAQSASDS
jgi:hypothetical protein